MFKTLSTPHKIVLLTTLLIVFVLSYVRWTHAGHTQAILGFHPEWDFNGYILYDGYGNYAEHIFDAIAHPSNDSFERLRTFTRGHIHASRPLYPLVVAIFNLALRNIVLSAFVVNALSGLLCIYAFMLILFRHHRYEGPDLFYPTLLLIAHVSLIGMFARPMSDALSFALFLFAIHFAFLFHKNRKIKTLAVLLGLIVLATLAKTVFVLLAASVPLAFIVASQSNWKKLVLRFCLFCIGPALLLILVLWLAKLAFPNQQWLIFFFQCMEGPLNFDGSPETLKFIAKAGLLFLVLSLQVYPFFILFNKKLLTARYALHWSWMLVYIAQRIVFVGFNLQFSRGRYGIPLTAGAIVLAYPVIRKLVKEKNAAFIVYGLAALNLALWIYTIISKA